MKVMLCGDPHGRDGIEHGQKLARMYDCSAVIFLGDCWDVDENYPEGPECYFLMGSHEKPVYSMPAEGYGNSTLLMNGETIWLGGISFGVWGKIDEDSHKHLRDENPLIWQSLGPKPKIWMDKPDELSRRFVACDVLLFHDAPYPFTFSNGRIGGSAFLSELVLDVMPRYAFGGHMHQFDYRKIGETECIQLKDLTALDSHDDEMYATEVVVLDTATQEIDLIRVPSTRYRENLESEPDI